MWSHIVVRHRRYVILAWAVLFVIAGLLAKNVTHGLTSTGFERPNSPAVWADKQLSHLQVRPSAEPLLIQNVPTSTVKAWAHRFSLPNAWLYRTGPDATTIVPEKGKAPTLLLPLQEFSSRHGAKTTWVSQTSVSEKVISDTRTTLSSSLPIALPFLIVLLLLVFGSVTAAFLPLVVAAVGAVVALGALDLLENVITLSAYLTDIVSFLSLGVGVDYALFISARFRQSLSEGKTADVAVGEAMAHAGRSVLFSGVAVAMALFTLFLGGNAYWRGIAIGGAVSVLAVLLVTHTLLPAILRILDRRINWGKVPFASSLKGFWPAISAWIRKRPYWAIALAVLALSIPGIFGSQLAMQTPANLAILLPRHDPLRAAVGAEQRAWGAGAIDPIVVAIDFRHPLSDVSTWHAIASVSRRIAGDHAVRSVESPTLLGISPALLAASASGHLHNQKVSSALTAFTNLSYNSHLVVLFVTARKGPNSAATIALTTRLQHQLRKWLPHQKSGVGGVTALLTGFNQLTQARLPWILLSVAGVATVVLFLATRSLWQALLGVVFDGLVALTTAGILVLTVQHGGLGLEAEPLNSSITPLVFVLLFGLSMDYEVILLHRIQELWNRGFDMRDAATEGLSRTGGMITGAGMIMVVVFIALLISPLEIMKTLAIGLTSAILLDTWIVRSFLVPGATVAIGPSAFWPSPRHLAEAGARQSSETEENKNE